MQFFIGLDLGTTHIKSVLMNEQGEAGKSFEQSHSTFRPMPGFEEQDPEDIFQAVLNVTAKAIQSVNEGDQILAIALSSAMHSVIPVDANGKPLAKAMIWSDNRSQQQVEKLSGTKLADTIFEQTGTPLHPMSPLFKIRWIKDEQPDIFTESARFISIKEYVWLRLFGEYKIDYSIASATGMFDLRNCNWSKDALEWAGVQRGQLSEPVSPVYCNKEPAADVLQRLPALKGITWVIGASDGALANLGSGCSMQGDAAVTIGTSGAVRITATDVRTDPKHRLFTYHMVPGLYICGGPINNGGIALQWLADILAGKSGADVETPLELAQKAPAGSDGLFFLPYLLGERAPVWDAEAKGAWVGLWISHTQQHLSRSVLEGVCYSLRELILLIEEAYGPIHRIAASGGFTQSDFWVQLLADVTGKPVQITNNPDASAVGAIFTGMYAMGKIKEWKEISRLLPHAPLVNPNKGHSDFYAKAFKQYQKLYPATESVRETTT